MNKISQLLHQKDMEGYITFFVSMLLYAFSGVVVVGLSTVFGGVGQLIFRGLFASLVVFIVMIALRLINGKSMWFTKKDYHPGWLGLDFLFRPLSTLSFVYAVIFLANNATQALFYLFAFRVIASLIIDLIMKEKITVWNWVGFSTVLVGLIIFSFPWNVAVIGVLLGAACGAIEAIQRKVWNKLKIVPEDRWLIGLCEFVAWFVIAGAIYLLIGATMSLQLFSLNTFGYLLLATLVAVGTMWLDIKAFSQENTLAGNVIQSSEMGFAGVINFLWDGTRMTGNQIVGAAAMIVSLVLIGMNKLFKINKK